MGKDSLKDAAVRYLDVEASGTATIGDVSEAKRALADAAGWEPLPNREEVKINPDGTRLPDQDPVR